MVKDIYSVGDNPYTFKQVKKNILKDLINFKNRIKISLSPNISEICYGRTVGYKITKNKSKQTTTKYISNKN